VDARRGGQAPLPPTAFGCLCVLHVRSVGASACVGCYVCLCAFVFCVCSWSLLSSCAGSEAEGGGVEGTATQEAAGGPPRAGYGANGPVLSAACVIRVLVPSPRTVVPRFAP
jgi:hypothetical protein